MWDFEVQTVDSVKVSKLELVIVNYKKEIYHIMKFILPANYRANLNEVGQTSQPSKRIIYMKLIVVVGLRTPEK